MSASREKKLRQDLAAQGITDPKLIREAEERAKARKTNTLYGIIAAVFVVVMTVVGMHRFCMCMTVYMSFLHTMFMKMGMLIHIQGVMTMFMMMSFMAVRIPMMSVQIFHIMIVILMFLIKKHIKITGVDPGFYHSADLYIEAFYRKAFKRSLQLFSVCTQIKKCRNGHISTDPGGTLQI